MFHGAQRTRNGRTGEKGKSPPKVTRAVGKVKSFDVAQGVGFITPDPNQGHMTILFTLKQLKQFGRKNISEGTEIVCDTIPGDGGPKVHRIISIGKEKVHDDSASTWIGGPTWPRRGR